MIYKLPPPPTHKLSTIKLKLTSQILTDRCAAAQDEQPSPNQEFLTEEEQIQYAVKTIFSRFEDPALMLGEGYRLAIKKRIEGLEREKHALFQAMKDRLKEEDTLKSSSYLGSPVKSTTSTTTSPNKSITPKSSPSKKQRLWQKKP